MWGEGRRRRRPSRQYLSSSTRRQASPGKCVFLKSGFLLVSRFLPSIFKPDGFCRQSWSLVEFFVVPVSLCPFPRTTVRVPLPSLLMEEYFRGCSARPHPAGPGLPVGFLTSPVPVRVLPPPLPIPWPSSSGSCSALNRASSGVRQSVVTP